MNKPRRRRARLSETEQAALEEIMTRAASSEVIFIVRPKDGNGQCEVIHMDSVSPEFVCGPCARACSR